MQIVTYRPGTHGKQIILFPSMVEVSPAERQCPEISLNGLEQSLSGLVVEGVSLGQVGRQRVVRAHAVLDNSAATRGAEGLDREILSLLHLCLVPIRPELLDDGYSFAFIASMYAIRPDRVSVQIADRFDLVCFSANLHFVRLHHLLNRISNVAHPDIDASLPDTSIRGIFDCLEQTIPCRLKVHCERGVNDSPVDMHAEVDLEDIVLLQDCRDELCTLLHIPLVSPALGV